MLFLMDVNESEPCRQHTIVVCRISHLLLQAGYVELHSQCMYIYLFFYFFRLYSILHTTSRSVSIATPRYHVSLRDIFQGEEMSLVHYRVHHRHFKYDYVT